MNTANPHSLSASAQETADPFLSGLLEHLPAILRYARVSVPLRDADDLTQDVFTQACANRHQFSGDDVGPWLYQIARTKIALYYRRKNVEGRTLQALGNFDPAGTASLNEDGSVEIASEELQAAIDALETTEREALRLKFSKSYSNKQIAELLQMTPGHLGVVLFRAIQKLRQKFNPAAANQKPRKGASV